MNNKPIRARHRHQPILQRLVKALTPTNRSTSPVPTDPDRLDAGIVSRQKEKTSFSDSLFGELLLELPMHRRRLSHARETGDTESLGKATHHLLGAVVYCDAPDLEKALRDLQTAIKTGKPQTIGSCHDRAIRVLDNTLRSNGSSA